MNVILICRGLSGDSQGNTVATLEALNGFTHGVKKVTVESKGHIFEFGKEYQVQINDFGISGDKAPSE